MVVRDACMNAADAIRCDIGLTNDGDHPNGMDHQEQFASDPPNAFRRKEPVKAMIGDYNAGRHNHHKEHVPGKPKMSERMRVLNTDLRPIRPDDLRKVIEIMTRRLPVWNALERTRIC